MTSQTDKDKVKNDLLQRLRDEILSEDSSSDPIDDDLDGLFDAILIDGVADPDVLQAVDALLADEGFLSIDQRERLVDGAKRGIRWRQAMTGPLTRLLRAERADHNIELTTLAASLEVDPERLSDFEHARVPLTEAGPILVARWIQEVGADTDAALEGLQQSLGLVHTRAFVGSGDAAAKPKKRAKKFYDEVEAVLRAGTGEG